MAEEADVIVVGAGLSGLVAATEIADAGKRVIVVDQEGEQSIGGQAFWSFGGLFLVNSPEQRRLGHASEAARAVRDCAAAHGVEHLVALIRHENLPSQGVARSLGMEVERTAFVHGTDALVFGMRLHRP